MLVLFFLFFAISYFAFIMKLLPLWVFMVHSLFFPVINLCAAALTIHIMNKKQELRAVALCIFDLFAYPSQISVWTEMNMILCNLEKEHHLKLIMHLFLACTVHSAHCRSMLSLNEQHCKHSLAILFELFKLLLTKCVLKITWITCTE